MTHSFLTSEFPHRAGVLQITRVAEWHDEAPQSSEDGIAGLIENQHLQNFLLWHEEDKARDPGADDLTIAEVKRRIDKLNQKRNDLIEKIDEALLAELARTGTPPNPESPLNSETPGSMIDRCSIMALKIYHMDEEANRSDADDNHRAMAREKTERLKVQRSDLIGCLGTLLEEIAAGKRHFRLYRQFKMYNDPSLNPVVYRRIVAQPS